MMYKTVPKWKLPLRHRAVISSSCKVPYTRGSPGQIMLKRLRLYLVPLAAAALLAAPPPPGAVPARIILTWTGDPATTQAVTWRTDVPRQTPQVQFAKLDADPDFEKNATAAPATAAAGDLGDGQRVNHYTGNLQ